MKYFLIEIGAEKKSVKQKGIGHTNWFHVLIEKEELHNCHYKSMKHDNEH